ncbi:MAG: cation-translocating P-type ATPase [Clostridia bacterium]|nr:cation-translocating P-type ATPase [Clostridia bacterium]
MFKKVSDFLNGIPMTIVSGVFLLASLALLITKNFVELNISPFLDFAWVTIVISGFPLVYLAVSRLLFKRWVSSALLITVAMIASICVGEVFAAGEVAFIMALGSILEDKTVERAKKGLNSLIKLSPQTGRIICEENGKTVEKVVNIDEIESGMKLRVLAGETIPVDGKIIVGNTSIDQSIMTGESLPVDKSVGDEVFCGTMNLYGSVDIVATKVKENSSLQKMIKLLKEAENKKAPMQRIADKWATWLVPVAILIAFVTSIVTYFVIGNENNAALIRGVTILVVFCPCALVLSTPTSVMAGIGQATKYGVLIKSGEALENMGKVNCIAFDKTGTLTFGKLTVSNIISFGALSENELLRITASVESRSEHPLGKAIVEYAKQNNADLAEISDFEMVAGKGVCGTIYNKKYICGNKKFLQENGIELTNEHNETLENLRSEGKAVILVADEYGLIGAIGLSDTLRPTAKETVRKLKALGYEIVLLTGDHKTTAEYFAQQVGITNIKSELLPEDKVNAITELQKSGYNVCMIGDGVNDAPALKTANVGAAMSGIGSDITTEAASIALMSDDIEKLPYLCILAKATINTIKFNISLSMTINFIAILLSSFGLLTPITGAIVHNVGSVLVVLNAALMYARKFIKKAQKI